MSVVHLAQDFADLLLCLQEAEAEYVVVGGYAVMAHGHVRATGDLDVFVRADAENAVRVMRALERFGAPGGVTVKDFTRPGVPAPSGIRFGRAPIAVDLLTSIQGVDFAEVWATRRTLRIGTVDVPFIGLEALRRAKLASGRTKDLADLEALAALDVNPDRDAGG